MDQQADDDIELLERYIRSGCERSFQLLVERYIGLVLACALRTTGDRQLAEEVAQKVFTLLANKAARVRPDVALGAWLHRATVFEATRARRGEVRRNTKLAAYARHMSTKDLRNSSQNDQWNNALPVLDEAINHLPQADRMMLVLRFFEGRKYRDIGIRVGKSEEASRKQIKRALEKLSVALQRKGIVLPVASLSVGLSNIHEAPASAELVGSVSATALSTSASLSTALAFVSMKKLTIAIVVLAAVPITMQGMKNRALARQVDSVGEDLVRMRDSGASSTSLLPSRKAGSKRSMIEAAVLGKLAIQIRAREENPAETRPLFASISLLQSLEETQLPKAFEMIQSCSDGDTQLHLYEALLAHWASFDLGEALRRAEGIPWIQGRVFGLEGVFRVWMENDLGAALAAVSNAKVGYRSRETIRQSASHALVASNPEAVAAHLATMERGTARDKLLETLASAWPCGDSDAAIHWAAGLEDPNERDMAVSSFVSQVMNRDPEAALEWAATLSTPKKRDEALKNALRRWIWADRAAAEDWIASSSELTDEDRKRLLNR